MRDSGTHDRSGEIHIADVTNCHAAQDAAGSRVVPFAQAISQLQQDVRITIVGTVVASPGLSPVADASVWVDLETSHGGETRAAARTDPSGRYAMQFVESDCSLATERAFRVFARKKGFADAELTDDGNGGQPVLRCTTREQVVDLQLQAG